MSPTQAWRILAKSFRITNSLVRRDRLPEDYQPLDAIELSTIAGWDDEHQRAFYNWANGRTLGRPCRYF